MAKKDNTVKSFILRVDADMMEASKMAEPEFIVNVVVKTMEK